MQIIEKLKALDLKQPIAVLGMGISGKAALGFLKKADYEVVGLDEKEKEDCQVVNLDEEQALKGYNTLIISPGIDARKKAIAEALRANSEVALINDVELFGRLVEKPVVAITGSNGKSTVVCMIADILNGQGRKAVLCGNIGRSVLEALATAEEDTEFFVLELSNYQLENCPSLKIQVGAVLNVSPDHLDRYNSYEDYVAAKANLAKQAQICVLNADDIACQKMGETTAKPLWFGLKGENRYSVNEVILHNYFVLGAEDLKIEGATNKANALVSLLVIEALGCNTDAALEVLKNFKGLSHRMSLVGEWNSIKWIDDSKATNIGATAAALAGIANPIWLIAGGVGKGQDFSLLATEIKKHQVKKVLLIGLDNGDLVKALSEAEIDFIDCKDMTHAIATALTQSTEGDVILLSPACASFDQFSGYAERGDCFAAGVRAVCH